MKTSSLENVIIEGVMHLSMLGVSHLRARVSQAESNTPKEESKTIRDATSFDSSWQLFLQEGVHSPEAARIIKTLITMTMHSEENEEVHQDDLQESERDSEVEPFEIRGEDMKKASRSWQRSGNISHYIGIG